MRMPTKLDYHDGDVRLEGMLVRPRTRPVGGVLVAHMAGGRVDFCVQVAHRYAGLGYVALALDMYGEGRVAQSKEEGRALMGPFLEDRGAMVRRMDLAFEALAGVEGVERDRIGAVGFCFGGLCVQDLARHNDELAAAVSFHGLLKPPPQVRDAPFAPALMVLHGALDPLVSADDRAAFDEEMRKRGADCTFVSFSQAMHAFTNPEADAPIDGLVFDATVSHRAFVMADAFFEERLGR